MDSGGKRTRRGIRSVLAEQVRLPDWALSLWQWFAQESVAELRVIRGALFVMLRRIDDRIAGREAESRVGQP